MGDSAAIPDDVEAFVAGLQVLIDPDLHIVELDFHAVEQGAVVGRAGSDLVEGIDHLDDAVEDPLGQHEGEVAGFRLQGRDDKVFRDALGRAAPAADQVTEALYQYAAAEHVGEAGDALAVAVAVLERLGEMLGYEQSEIRILRLAGRIFKTVAVDGHDPVGILVDNDAARIHAEGPHQVLKFLGAVDDLALIQLIGQMGEEFGGQLHAHAKVHTVGFGRDGHLPAYLLHPFAAAAADGDDALFAGVALRGGAYDKTVVIFFEMLDGAVEKEINMIPELFIKVLKNDIIDIGAQMTDGCIQELKAMLHAQLFEGRARCCVKLCPFAAVAHVDAVDVLHQGDGFALADVAVQGPAKVICDIIFSVGERAGSAKAAHDRAGLAVDTAFDPVAVDGTFSPGQLTAGLEDRCFQLRRFFHKFIGCKDPARAGADHDHIIIHGIFLRLRVRTDAVIWC